MSGLALLDVGLESLEGLGPGITHHTKYGMERKGRGKRGGEGGKGKEKLTCRRALMKPGPRLVINGRICR